MRARARNTHTHTQHTHTHTHTHRGRENFSDYEILSARKDEELTRITDELARKDEELARKDAELAREMVEHEKTRCVMQMLTAASELGRFLRKSSNQS